MSISESPFVRSGIRHLLVALSTAVYFPEVLVLAQNTERNNCPLSGMELDYLIDQFDAEEKKILYALQRQFSSTDPTQDHRFLVEVIFGFVDGESNFFEGLHRSLAAIGPYGHTLSTLLLNNPDASPAEIEAVREENELKKAQLQERIQRVPEVLVRSLVGFVMRY